MENFQGIGMHLNSDHTISYVEKLSPADIAGIKKDQKLIYINHVYVENMPIYDIVKLIKENINDLTIGLRSTDTKNITTENKINPETPVQEPANENIIYQNVALTEEMENEIDDANNSSFPLETENEVVDSDNKNEDPIIASSTLEKEIEEEG